MVSRANVPRKMTSATRLTEAEEIELEWESLLERIGASLEWESLWERIGASFWKIQREQEAKLDKVLRSLQDLRSTMEARDASSSSWKSQVELPKFSDNLDFQKLIDVDRAIADVDLMEQHSSGGYEEMDTELEIGVEDCARVSKEIEDIQFLEVTVTPLQKTEEMEIFASLPHNGKSTKVKKGRELEQDKLKGTERLSHARQNALVSELIVGLPISACYSLSLSWLLNWFPRPTVKLKFVAQCDAELYEGFDDRSKGFVGYGEFSISDAREHSGIEWENGSTLVQIQPDQRSGDPLPGLFDGVFPLSDFGGNVFGVSRGLKRSSLGDAFRGASRYLMNLIDESDAFYLPIVVQLMHILFCCGEENVLQYQPSVPNRQNKVPLHIRVPQDGIDACTSGSRVIIQGEGVNYRMDKGYKQLRGDNLRGLCHHENSAKKPQERLLLNDCLGVAATKFSNPVSHRCFWTDVGVTKGNLHISLVNEIEAYKMISRKSPCSKRISSPASIFTLLKEIGGLGHVHMGEKAVALVLMDVIMVSLVMKMKSLTSLANWVFDGGGFNRAIYIDVLVEDALLTATLNLERSLYECAILQLYNMLLVDVSWELVDESMVVGRESVMSVKNALAILGKEWGKSRRFVLQFDTDVKGEGSAGRKEAYGAKSGANWALQILTTLTVNGSTYRLLEWLLVWVPKPSVKMTLGRDDSIQGFPWVPFPDAYMPYFPGDILLRDREATLNILVIKVNLKRATARMKNQGVAQVLVHWVHSSLADATWESAEEIKACFPGFIADDEA